MGIVTKEELSIRGMVRADVKVHFGLIKSTRKENRLKEEYFQDFNTLLLQPCLEGKEVKLFLLPSAMGIF